MTTDPARARRRRRSRLRRPAGRTAGTGAWRASSFPRRCSVHRPVQPAERDERGTDRALRVDDEAAEIEAATRAGTCQRPEDDHVGAGDQQQAPREWTLAQARGVVLELVKPGAARDEAIDRPANQ